MTPEVVRPGEVLLVEGYLSQTLYANGPAGRFELYAFRTAGPFSIFPIPDVMPPGHYVGHELSFDVGPARWFESSVADPVPLDIMATMHPTPAPCDGPRPKSAPTPVVIARWRVPTKTDAGWTLRWGSATDRNAVTPGNSGGPLGPDHLLAVRFRTRDDGTSVCPWLELRDAHFHTVWTAQYACVAPGTMALDVPQALVPVPGDNTDPTHTVAWSLVGNAVLGSGLMAAALAATRVLRAVMSRRTPRTKEAGPAGP